MTPVEYLQALLRHWRTILACMLLAAVGAALTSPDITGSTSVKADPVTYSSTVTLVQDPGTQRNLDVTLLYMRRGQVPLMVAKAMGKSPAELNGLYTIEGDEKVGAITITAHGQDAASAAKLASAVADQSMTYFKTQARKANEERLAEVNAKLATLTAKLDDLAQKLAKRSDSMLAAQRDAVAATYGRLAQEQETITLEPTGSGMTLLEKTDATQTGVAGFAPPASRTARLALGVALGLGLGVVLALVLDRFDTRVRRREDVEQVLGAPVVAEIPRTPRRDQAPAAVTENPTGQVAESFRSLRSALTLLPARSLAPGSALEGPPVVHQPPSSVVLFTGCRGGEGTSSTVVNLAATFAASGRHVLLVDADLRRPRLSELLGVPPAPGLADLANGALDDDVPVDVEEYLRDTSLAGVRLLAAGRVEQSSGLLPARLGPIVENARRLADVVLVDSAPLSGLTGAVELMPYVDSAVLVVRAERTVAQSISQASQVLSRMRVPVLGAVLVGGSTSSIPLLAQQSGTGRRTAAHSGR
jgi:Mrp family chromosome partitioning ATPase